MEVCRRSSWLLLLLGVSLLANILQGVQGEVESEGPSESECRPYIEKALKELETGESDTTLTPETEDSKEDLSTVEVTTDDSDRQEGDGDNDTHEEGTESIEDDQNLEDEQVQEGTQEEASEEETGKSSEGNVDTQEEIEDNEEAVISGEEKEEDTEEQQEKVESEEGGDAKSQEGEDAKSQDGGETEETTEDEDTQERVERETAEIDQTEDTKEETDSREESHDTNEADDEDETVPDKETESVEDHVAAEEIGQETQEASEESKQEEKDDTQEDEDGDQENQSGEKEGGDNEQDDKASDQESENSKQESTENVEEGQQTSQEEDQENTGEQIDEDTREDETKEDEHDGGSEGEQDTKSEDDKSETKEDEKDETNEEQEAGSPEAETAGETDERSAEKDDDSTDKTVSEGSEEGKAQTESTEALEENSEVKNTGDENSQEGESREQTDAVGKTTEEDDDSGEDAGEETAPVEELSLDVEIPSELRDRNHVEHLLKLDEEASETEKIINRVAEITLRELKKLYENAIKPLEVLYKYRDLSNRHFGDAEIFSKPLILFMGPWSGGKSSIINYLLDNEYNETSLRTGAEPSPAYFNILMYGDEPEIWDGTQLAADFTFSGLQKFGQGLEERLRGVRLPNKLLEKVNIVEIPGILEVRKQVSRVFPFNDACQWFIDRADIIFLVYDPSKLDVGPETEAILDQLKGREHQTRIILNKADQVKPEELMRVQGALIWNISPLMSSPQPPVMYTTSLWSRPYEPWAPVRLLHAQERAFLRDLRSAIDKRIENKIASARRFAVRVRNHAKMVDCYLTTYYNHKSVFGNRKQVADEIIEHPQDYHIYEGLSTLTNISRYDLPDPDVYRDFFKLNPLYDFQQLSATCTYFRGCPINRLDVAIAYDLPELVGKHKRLVESALAEANQTPVPSS